jgi:hypothetical protein
MQGNKDTLALAVALVSFGLLLGAQALSPFQWFYHSDLVPDFRDS